MRGRSQTDGAGTKQRVLESSRVACWMSCQAQACDSLHHVTSDILSKWYCVTTWQSNVMLRRLSLFVLRHQVSLVHQSALLTTKTALSSQLSRQIRHIQSGTCQPKEQITSEKIGYCVIVLSVNIFVAFYATKLFVTAVPLRLIKSSYIFLGCIFTLLSSRRS